LFDSAKRLQIPSYEEGFDELFYVWIDDQSIFVVEPWKNSETEATAAMHSFTDR
jgi:hypothetical protein